MALLSAGLVTERQLHGPPLYMVSDDPLDSSREIVTIDVPGKPIHNSLGPMIYPEIPYVAFVARSSGRVSLAGKPPTEVSAPNPNTLQWHGMAPWPGMP